MVPGADRGHPPLKLLLGKGEHGVQGPPGLEGPGDLEEFQLQEDLAALGREEADTVILRAMTSYQAGGNPAPAVREFASAMQIEPEQAAGMLEGIANGSLDRAAQYISSRHKGINGQDVLDWAGENLRSTTKASIMAAIYNGAVSELDKLVSKYRIKERY